MNIIVKLLKHTEEVHRIKLDIFLHILLPVIAKVSAQVSMSRLNVLPFPFLGNAY